mmetsp:Transcript_575/g.2316  ORF Transcript_575/g.2316 Transcript_575/m.2316 type:complete len:308 (+) Transcript_575:3022-3945(+)
MENSVQRSADSTSEASVMVRMSWRHTSTRVAMASPRRARERRLVASPMCLAVRARLDLTKNGRATAMTCSYCLRVVSMSFWDSASDPRARTQDLSSLPWLTNCSARKCVARRRARWAMCTACLTRRPRSCMISLGRVGGASAPTGVSAKTMPARRAQERAARAAAAASAGRSLLAFSKAVARVAAGSRGRRRRSARPGIAQNSRRKSSAINTALPPNRGTTGHRSSVFQSAKNSEVEGFTPGGATVRARAYTHMPPTTSGSAAALPFAAMPAASTASETARRVSSLFMVSFLCTGTTASPVATEPTS